MTTNFTLFPLYQQLLNKVPKDVVEITHDDRIEINNYIKKHSECAEAIYALIKAYSIDHGNQAELPYNMTVLKSGHKVTFGLLPPRLQHIILLCIRIK